MYRQPIAIKQCSIQFLNMFSAQALQTGIIIYIYIYCVTFIYKMNVYRNRRSVTIWESLVKWNDVCRKTNWLFCISGPMALLCPRSSRFLGLCDTHRHKHSDGLTWKSDQHTALAGTYTAQSKLKRRQSMRSEGSVPEIYAIHTPQKYASVCKPHGIGKHSATLMIFP